MGKGRILVVEDDLDISKMLRIYFDSQGYEVFVANRGHDALDTVRKKLPDVAVLDINLPDIDGYEITHSLKTSAITAHIPVIAMTANVMKKDRENVMQAGCDGFISKPIDIDDLPIQIEHFLQKGKKK